MITRIPTLLSAKIEGLRYFADPQTGQRIAAVQLDDHSLIFASRSGDIQQSGKLFLGHWRYVFPVEDVAMKLLTGAAIIDFGVMEIDLRRTLGWWQTPNGRSPIFVLCLDNDHMLFAAADQAKTAPGEMWWAIPQADRPPRLFSINAMRTQTGALKHLPASMAQEFN